MEACPCGSGISFAECCQPLIDGSRRPLTAEALMRARYSAFVKGAVDYIYDTIHPNMKGQFKREAVAAWSRNAEWLGLDVLRTTEGQPGDAAGTVEFIARYKEKGKTVHHHEIAEFVKSDDAWFFYDGAAPKPTQVIRQGPKIGRNDPCGCGSGKKFKKCCGG